MKTLQAKDLRIGNYLHELCDNKKEVISVKEIHSGDFRFAIITNKDELISSDFFEPIELTEDVLMKCKFYENILYDIRVGCYGEYCTILSFRLNEDKELSVDVYDEGSSEGVGIPMKHIKYLHQLQNLVQCLTGQELEVKL
jgi:hypothetical protein